MVAKKFILELLEKLDGIQSIESIMDILDIDRSTAIFYIHLLRKEGYVKTKQVSSKKRIYNISRQHKLGGKSYYEIINSISPIKLSESDTYKIYGRKVSLEETLIYAIKTKNLRVILAALALFKKINDWTLLGFLARKNNLERQVGALYDLAREIMKTRRMSHQLRKSILRLEGKSYIYIISNLKSKDYNEIEERWKVYIPFNKEDLVEYSK